MDKFIIIHNTTFIQNGVEYTKAHDLNNDATVEKRKSEVLLNEQLNRIMYKYDVPKKEIKTLTELIKKEYKDKAIDLANSL